MTALADLVRGFATLLKPAEGNDVKLTERTAAACAAAMPHLRSLTNGLEIDRAAVGAGLTLPYHDGRTEGVNTGTKRIMRQMHGRAGFDLLRHRILLPCGFAGEEPSRRGTVSHALCVLGVGVSATTTAR